MSAPAGRIPCWVDVALIPLINIALAFLVSGVILWFVGVDPVFAVEVILYGAFGYDLAIGYTLYYTTNFVFTGLAVAVAFHAGLFRSEEPPSELQSLMRNSYAVLCLKQTNTH